MFEKSKLIEKILRDSPEARNSDKVLIMKLWEHQGWQLTESQKGWYYDKLIPAETIRRNRQKLQEAGRFLSDKQVAKARKKLAEQTRQEVAQDNARQRTEVQNLRLI